MEGRGRYAESLLRWRNFPHQAVVEVFETSTRRQNSNRTMKTFEPLCDKVLPLRRKLLHENKENIFDNFDCRNYSIIELESSKKVEAIKKDKYTRPVLYPRSSSRKTLKVSPREISKEDYDNQMDSHSIDTSRVLSEDKRTITCSGGEDINLNQRGTMMGHRPSTLGASIAATSSDSCYFSPISPLSEPRCKDLSIIEKIEDPDTSSVCEDITDVSAISDESISSVHEHISVALPHAHDEDVFCSTFCYPLHSTVLNFSLHREKKSDDFNMTTLIDSSASCVSDQDSCEETESKTNSPSSSPLSVGVEENTWNSCVLNIPSPPPALSVCIEDMEQVDLSTSGNNSLLVKRSTNTGTPRRAPIGRESYCRTNQLHPRSSVFGRTYASKQSIGTIASKHSQGIAVLHQAPVIRGRDCRAVPERLPTEGQSIVLDNRFVGRRLKRQIGNTELNRCQVIKPRTITGRESSPKTKVAINGSTIDSLGSSRSTLFASRVSEISGRDVYLRDEYTEVSIDVDLPGSALFSTENSRIGNVSSSDTATKIKPLFRKTLSDKISGNTVGSIEGPCQSTNTIIEDPSVRKYCDEISSKSSKYREYPKISPSVRTHCLYCSEKLTAVQHDQTKHMSKRHHVIKEVVHKPNQEEFHKCLAVDSMQLGRRKFLAKKVQHIRRALRNDGYTQMTTMGHL